MRVAVIGSGALGCLLATALHPTNRIVMFGRWQAQIDAIRTKGLTVITPEGNRRTYDIPAATEPEASAGQFDAALLAVKSAGTARAVQDAQLLLTPAGLGITFQNGLGNLGALQAALGSDRATAAVTSQGASIVGPGIVRHAGIGVTFIGVTIELRATAFEGAQQLCADLGLAGWDCRVAGNLDELIWTKLAVNAAINPLTAILGVRNGDLLQDPAAIAIMDAAARETVAVAKATGIQLNAHNVVARAMQVARDTADNESSMLQDVRRGAQTEIDAICGAIVQRGRAVGVAVPVNEALLAHVRHIGLGTGSVGLLDARAVLAGLAATQPANESGRLL